jgi:hypothetical protein
MGRPTMLGVAIRCPVRHETGSIRTRTQPVYPKEADLEFAIILPGTGTVAGSKYLIENAEHRLLIDCGLFQGFKELRLRN